jgi:Ser/Thr protein kinase RdoA (MazF antagonist)
LARLHAHGPDDIGDQLPESFADFELDNLAWTDDASIAYDFDDAGRSWYVADIAQALRDLLPNPVVRADTPTVTAFLTGYRSVGDLPDAEVARLAMFSAAHAAAWLIRLPTVLASDPSPNDPPWLVGLRAKLHAKAAQQRAIILANDHSSHHPRASS